MALGGGVWDSPDPILDRLWGPFKIMPTFFQKQQMILVNKKFVKLGAKTIPHMHCFGFSISIPTSC